MGLDNYWQLPVDDVDGVERGDSIEYEIEMSDGVETRTYEVESDADSIPTWVAAEVGSDDAPDTDGEFQLTGGLMSGHGPHSFRGKVYNEFVKEYTGVTLYEHEIDAETVERMAEELEELTWEDIGPRYHGGYNGFHNQDEFEDFKRMFRVMADADAFLVGWW